MRRGVMLVWIRRSTFGSSLDTPVYLRECPGYGALPSRAPWLRRATFEAPWIHRSTFESALDTALYLRELPGCAALPSRAPGIRGPTFGENADLTNLPWIRRLASRNSWEFINIHWGERRGPTAGRVGGTGCSWARWAGAPPEGGAFCAAW